MHRVVVKPDQPSGRGQPRNAVCSKLWTVHLTGRAHTHICLVERVTFHSCALCMAQDVFRVKKSPRHHFVFVHFHLVPCRCKNTPHCSCPHKSHPHQSAQDPDVQRLQHSWEEKASGKYLASPLAGVGWPNPAPNTGYEPKPYSFFQLHGHGAHADQLPRQPPRFPVPGRRYRDLHHRSRRFCRTQGASSRSKTAASRVPSTFGPPSLWKQMDR